MSASYHLLRASRTARLAHRQPQNSGGASTMYLPTVDAVADVGLLLRTCADRSAWAGPAAGLDGLTWDDLGAAEAGTVFRAVRRAVLRDEYHAHPERRRSIPRPGRSPRPLDIGSVVDRTVAAALAGLMSGPVSRYLGPYSFAYRPRVGHLHMLAWLAAIARAENRWVLGNSDIASAFPSVPIDGVLEAHRALLAVPALRHRRRQTVEDDRLLRFVDRVLRGRSTRTQGLSQGNPYSPIAMELYMYRVLDEPMLRDPTSPPRLRYCDNLAPLCRSVSEAHLDRARCRDLLAPHGLQLKEPSDPEERTTADLRAGETTRLLGYVVGARDGRVTFGVGRDSWTRLRESLIECHHTPNPTETARLVVAGWIGALGPAFEGADRPTLISTVTGVAREAGFRETNSEALAHLWQTAWVSWARLRTDTERAHRELRRRSGS